jgi:inner membrane protein
VRIAQAAAALLDACTSYGTQLLWPSAHRVAWDVISIVDPLFTLTLLVGLVWARWRRSRAPAAVALAVCALYLGLGALQRERAMAAQASIAAARGHAPARAAVFPTVGNNVVWRSLYQVGDRLHADRIRVAWPGTVQWAEGSELRAVSERDLAAEASADGRVLVDFRRFRWFSDGWVVRAPGEPSWVADARYSLRTDVYDPIWGIRFHPGRPVPTEWVDRSAERTIALGELWAELAGTHSTYRPLPGPSAGSHDRSAAGHRARSGRRPRAADHPRRRQSPSRTRCGRGRPRAATSPGVGPLGPTAASMRRRASASRSIIERPASVSAMPREVPFPARVTVSGVPSAASACRR